MNIPKITADEIIRKRFMTGDPRSEEYKAGVRAILTWQLDGDKSARRTYTKLVQLDAYYAGISEGWFLAEQYNIPLRLPDGSVLNHEEKEFFSQQGADRRDFD